MERIIVKTYLEWLDVKAYGTFQEKIGNDEIWEFDGKEYVLNFINLPLHEKEELLYAYKTL